jgi:hypothetical protein
MTVHSDNGEAVTLCICWQDDSDAVGGSGSESSSSSLKGEVVEGEEKLLTHCLAKSLIKLKKTREMKLASDF